MPIMITSDLAGATQDDYEHLAAALLAVLKTADGFIAHAAGPIEGGYRVSELWESEEAHRAWFEAYVVPSLPAGAPRPVKVTTDHPALASAFEVVIGPGFDVGAHVHAHGEELFYIVEGELDVSSSSPRYPEGTRTISTNSWRCSGAHLAGQNRTRLPACELGTTSSRSPHLTSILRLRIA